MAHPLVTQLRFTRSEWRRALDGVTPEEAARRFGTINPVAWMVGHLAWHEQLYWLERAQGRTLVPAVTQCGFGQPACAPPLEQMWAAWRVITEAADPYLDTLTAEGLRRHHEVNGKPVRESIGTNLQRIIYHYWFHLGESQAVRQLLGHAGLPQFVGDFSSAPYRPEGA